jgi:hypothetical protein
VEGRWGKKFVWLVVCPEFEPRVAWSHMLRSLQAGADTTVAVGLSLMVGCCLAWGLNGIEVLSDVYQG